MSTLQMDQVLADKIVDRAVAYCADRNFAGRVDEACQALREGQCEACKTMRHSLVRQIGDYLGQTDKTVKAVYTFDARPGNGRAGDEPPFKRQPGINLIAWVDRKSAALAAIGSTLESAIAKSRRRLGCPKAMPACFTLDMQMVDDQDIQDQRGFGVLVLNPHIHSAEVWTRLEPFERSYPAEVEESPAGSGFRMNVFNPELAPEEMLIEQALLIENLPADERAPLEHRLSEEKVVLIRRLISDQLAYINVAKEWFTVSDLAEIRRRKIGHGKIGGKSAGLLLAARILDQAAGEALKARIHIPQSYFIGSDGIYVFMSMNGLTHWNDQKYKPEEQIRSEYPQILEEFQGGEFPPEIVEKLQEVLEEIGPQPLIVRSSSQLEDNFGTSFAGKYDSHFCPNQGTADENLRALTQAIAQTYASTLKPEALLYRRSKGLQDYDERMAILIQVVQGEKFGRYFFPPGAGVAFSRNIYRWSPEIRREAGFVRLVWGLGTRAVERVGNDYPRLVALSHPLLQPDDSFEAVRRYSQKFVDLIDLEDNQLKTLPIHQVLASNYPTLRYIAQLEGEGYFTTPRTRVCASEIGRLAITFQELLRRTPFADTMAQVLRLIEQNYHSTVDMEFTLQVANPAALQPEIKISLLQCRPQCHLQPGGPVRVPRNLPLADVVFSTRFMVPCGAVSDIRYVLFVQPEAYFALPAAAERAEVGRIIGRLNASLGPKSFICAGPGRWGTTNPDLGVYVDYADIHNASALVELAGRGIGPAPEPSLGTHFFQDLMEAQIYPLAISFDEEEVFFNRDFFYKTPNSLQAWLPMGSVAPACLRLIEVGAFREGHHLELVMDDEKGEAVAYLAADPESAKSRLPWS